MKISIISGSCVAAVCVVLSSFANPQPQQAGGQYGYTATDASLVQDTVPRRAATSPRKSAAGSTSTRQQGSMGNGSQHSDTRGEGTKKGRKGMNRQNTEKSADTTNHGATNIPDATRAQF